MPIFSVNLSGESIYDPYEYIICIVIRMLVKIYKHTWSLMENLSLLIMDKHESHLSIVALDLAKENGVIILTLHPHTPAKLQPMEWVFTRHSEGYLLAIKKLLQHRNRILAAKKFRETSDDL